MGRLSPGQNRPDWDIVKISLVVCRPCLQSMGITIDLTPAAAISCKGGHNARALYQHR